MAVFANVKHWCTETPGENLFLYLYKLVEKDIVNPIPQHSWINSNQILNEFFRLITVIDLTHRCFSIGKYWLKSNDNANAEFITQKLIENLELPRNNKSSELGELVRLACLAVINQKLTEGMKNTIHKETPPLCCWCGTAISRNKNTPKNEKATVEHLWPEFLGGTSIVGNLTVACNQSNSKRKHAFSWAWFGVQSFYEVPDDNIAVSREIRLAIALHRLIKVASGQSRLSRNTMTLKEASMRLKGIIPTMVIVKDEYYTFLDLLNLASE